MKFEEYEIIEIIPEIPDVFLLRIKPKKKSNVMHFAPGQFFHLKNPTYIRPEETRPFSAVTTSQDEYIEFCIKTYGPWTKALLHKKPGESILLFGPMGVFTLQQNRANMVFLAGGVGIAPIHAMIQHLDKEKSSAHITLVYANRNSSYISKRESIEKLFEKKPHWNYIPIVSQMQNSRKWKGHHGHITEEFLKREIQFSNETIFYICGSFRFTRNMVNLLQKNNIDFSHIKLETFSSALQEK